MFGFTHRKSTLGIVVWS